MEVRSPLATVSSVLQSRILLELNSDPLSWHPVTSPTKPSPQLCLLLLETGCHEIAQAGLRLTIYPLQALNGLRLSGAEFTVVPTCSAFHLCLLIEVLLLC